MHNTLKVHILEPTKLDFNKMKNMEQEDAINSMKGKIICDMPVPTIKLKRPATSLQSIKPQITINKFSHILGVSNEKAIDLYSKGARGIEELIKNCKKYDISIIQINGCIYFNDLLIPINPNEERDWVDFIKPSILSIKEVVLSSVIQSRPNGIHSRMEVMICVCNNIRDVMTDFFDTIQDHIPKGMENIFEIYNDGIDDNTPWTLSRIKSICCLNNRNIILDLTIYLPHHHPYPLLRSERATLEEKGYDLRDDGIYHENIKISSRRIFGRDNPVNVEELYELLDSLRTI